MLRAERFARREYTTGAAVCGWSEASKKSLLPPRGERRLDAAVAPPIS
jgi:hypothetical protein